MDAVTAVKKGWAKILLGFYDWLRTEKKFELPDSGASLVDEWVEVQVDKASSTLSVIADIIGGSKAPMDEEEIPIGDPDEGKK